jgi:hypothetical protein
LCCNLVDLHLLHKLIGGHEVVVVPSLDTCHIPKIWNVIINKIGTMLAWLDLKIHKELKLFV